MGKLKSDAEYLREAYKWAAESGDLSTQNGAVLVDPATGEVVATGFNDVHPPLADTPERRQRPLKYQWTEHAERDTVFDAARHGVRTQGKWLYVPWAACADCARAIVYAGISKVVRHKIPQHAERPDWAASCEAGDQMFREAGVEVVDYVGELGVSFRFDGREIQV